MALGLARSIAGDIGMGQIKADFYRFFALGFVAGTMLVLATIGIRGAGEVASGVVPSALAAPAAQ